MKSLTAFIEKNFKYIVIVLLLVNFLNGCGDNGSKTINKRLDKLTSEIQLLKDTTVSKTDLKIEGLKAEKRMIQATDRKMLDVQRQSQIDNEIKRLEEK